ncbi:MAG: translation initiation factor IF-3 [Oscillospiraceae bacterium]|jgi:translation initiation factor IF-3
MFERRRFCLRFLFDSVAWRCLTINNKELQINEEIRDKEVRVIGADGDQLGIITTAEAMRMAIEKNLDLVKIAPQASPPVCRIMDYGKYRFEQAKKEKEARKNQKTVEIKEIRMSLNIDTNDFNTKVNHTIKFLKGGDKVKVSVRFRGREMAHTNLGNELLGRFKEACSEYGVVEKAPKMEGRSMSMVVSAKPVK